MMDMLEFITDTLKSAAARVYLEKAPEGTDFPYVTYRFPTSNEAEFREDFILEVNLWDHGEDTTALEELTEDVDEALNRTKHLTATADMQLSVYRINRMMIPDPDPKIRRRELRYEVKAYLS